MSWLIILGPGLGEGTLAGLSVTECSAAGCAEGAVIARKSDPDAQRALASEKPTDTQCRAVFTHL
eukprot:3914006-Amphidinium_carterae.1